VAKGELNDEQQTLGDNFAANAHLACSSKCKIFVGV